LGNPWLDLPLADYEGHMALPQVAQAQLLGDVFEQMLREFTPPSVAILGCSGGNGVERIAPGVTTRVVGVDVNSGYLGALRARFAGRFQQLDLIAGDIQHDGVAFKPVAMVFAALLFEYVDVGVALPRIRSWLEEGGTLGTVVQLPSVTLSAVTPSPYASIQVLAPHMRLVPPARLRELAELSGFGETASSQRESSAGKLFQVQQFRAQ